MGNSSSQTPPPAPSTAAGAAAPGTASETNGGGANAVSASTGGCPVKHRGAASSSHASTAGATGGCPVKHGDKAPKGKVYNVYSQEIDPSNQMPANPNNSALYGDQKFPLPQERVPSTIPKGGTEGTWLFPSPQMFFNALRRKGKGDDVNEEDAVSIVAVHNNMNERTWKQVAEWEKLHCDKCPDPKLLRFLGKPDDLTPKAWFKHRVLGGPAPFDRHDWTIDRCGEEVRYVIDYYYDGEKADGDELPGLHSAGAVRSITVDARPALDSFTAVSDRARLWISGREPAALAKAEQELAAAASRKAAQGEELASRDRDAASAVERMGRGEEQMDVPRVFAFVQGRCGQVFEELRAATAALEESAGKEGKGDGNVLETLAQKQQMATIKLRTCVGRLVGCRGEADAMVEDPCEGNMERLEACMTAFEARANAASKGV